MKKFTLAIFSTILIFTPLVTVAAQDKSLEELGYQEESFDVPENYYYQGRVVNILEKNFNDDPFISALERLSQLVEVELLSGPKKGEIMELSYVPGSTGNAQQDLKVGEKVVIIQTELAGEQTYYIAGRHRLEKIIWLFAGFLLLVVAFAGWKGLRSIAGLGFTIVLIVLYIIPQILQGQDPFKVFLIASFLITFFSIYLGHGFNRRTTIAVISTLITISLTIGITFFIITWTRLFGLGSEEAFYIQVGDLSMINLQGLLLGGIIIGVLGVLDDITTAQAAVVEQLYRANDKLSFTELVKRGLSVGHEHVTSLVNTLALAYVGASFPLLLLFGQKYSPIWVSLNSERVIEEVVRTLIGSSALIVAVPITTYLAAYYFSKFGVNQKSLPQHHHEH